MFAQLSSANQRRQLKALDLRISKLEERIDNHLASVAYAEAAGWRPTGHGCLQVYPGYWPQHQRELSRLKASRLTLRQEAALKRPSGIGYAFQMTAFRIKRSLDRAQGRPAQPPPYDLSIGASAVSSNDAAAPPAYSQLP